MLLAEQIHTKMGQDTTLFPAPVPELTVVVQRAGAKGAAAKRRTILLVCCVEFKS